MHAIYFLSNIQAFTGISNSRFRKIPRSFAAPFLRLFRIICGSDCCRESQHCCRESQDCYWESQDCDYESEYWLIWERSRGRHQEPGVAPHPLTSRWLIRLTVSTDCPMTYQTHWLHWLPDDLRDSMPPLTSWLLTRLTAVPDISMTYQTPWLIWLTDNLPDSLQPMTSRWLTRVTASHDLLMTYQTPCLHFLTKRGTENESVRPVHSRNLPLLGVLWGVWEGWLRLWEAACGCGRLAAVVGCWQRLWEAAGKLREASYGCGWLAVVVGGCPQFWETGCGRQTVVVGDFLWLWEACWACGRLAGVV